VDPARARHLERVRHIRESFAEANERLVARLRRADHAAAERGAEGGGWSAAQIGWHVAAVTTRFASLMSGDAAGVQPLPPDFAERDWTVIGGTIPSKLQAPRSFEPPARVTRDEAVAALEASGLRLARALDRVTPERGAGFGLSSPIVGGTITVYQIGEWATAHVIRHNRQAKRALGEG
jgi:hypothetical protein